MSFGKHHCGGLLSIKPCRHALGAVPESDGSRIRLREL